MVHREAVDLWRHFLSDKDEDNVEDEAVGMGESPAACILEGKDVGAEEQAARAVELSVEALTLIKAHIVECNARNMETIDGIKAVSKEVGGVYKEIGSLKNYVITLLLSVVGFLVAKLMGWL